MNLNPPDLSHIRSFTQAKQAAIYLVALHQNMKLLWCCACLHDGLEINDRNVVFSEGNPHVKKLNRTIAALWKARGEYEEAGFNLTAITFYPLEEAQI